MEDALEKQLKSLSLNNSTNTEKPQQQLPVRNNSRPISSVHFENHKLLGGFQITEKQEYAKNMDIPPLISLNSINKLNGTYLGTGFDTAVKLTDYQAYHELKQEFFLKWMIEEKYHQAVINKKYKKPTFVCFGGRITDSLMTPAISRFGDWKIYAAKFNDAIYLWDEKEGREAQRVCDLQSFYGIYFEHLLTHSDPESSKINEFDKIFAINEITFGSHQLLSLSELDAETENKEWAEIKVYKQCSPKGMYGKFLKYWAQSIVPGVKTLVIGRHENGQLKNVVITSTDELAKRNGLRINECYDFEDRLLQFINSHFSVNDPKVVKTFFWRDGDFHVRVEDVPEKFIPKLMLPQWYIDAVISQTKLKTEETKVNNAGQKSDKEIETAK